MAKAKNKTAADQLPTNADLHSHPADEHPHSKFISAMETYVERFPEADVQTIKDDLHKASELFREMSDRDLTLAQRRRKVGAGIRNYGFIVKVAELAAENPQFASLFNRDVLNNCIFNFEESRNINVMLQAMARQTSNSMLTYSDEAYSLALIFYNSVKELARRGVPDAITLFRELQPFFRRRNPERASKPPTEKQILRDARAILHGKKEGEIVIEGHAKQTTPAEKSIVDDTHKPQRQNFKETVTGTVCKHCGCENGEGYNFCKECGEKLVNG